MKSLSRRDAMTRGAAALAGATVAIVAASNEATATDHPGDGLVALAAEKRQSVAAMLEAAQFPDPIPATTIRKPATW